MTQTVERDKLINRLQMVTIAREYNVFISIGTIHRWANDPDFPTVVGQVGKYFLYYQSDFTKFLNQRLRKIQEAH